MDSKGRIVVPAGFRETLRAGDPVYRADAPVRLILNFGDHLLDRGPESGQPQPAGCLRIFTYDGYTDVEATIAAHPIGSTERRVLQYLYMSQREEMEVDKEGRIILGAELRRRLGLDEGEVRMLGMGDYLELWSEARFAARMGAEVEDVLLNLPAGMDPLSLPVKPRGG